MLQSPPLQQFKKWNAHGKGHFRDYPSNHATWHQTSGTTRAKSCLFHSQFSILTLYNHNYYYPYHSVFLTPPSLSPPSHFKFPVFRSLSLSSRASHTHAPHAFSFSTSSFISFFLTMSFCSFC